MVFVVVLSWERHMFIYNTGEKKPMLSKRLTIKHKEKRDDKGLLGRKRDVGQGEY